MGEGSSPHRPPPLDTLLEQMAQTYRYYCHNSKQKTHIIKLNNYALYQCMAYAQKLDSLDPLIQYFVLFNQSDLANGTRVVK